VRVERIGDATLYIGDCVESMRQMEDGSVNTCVTSPPYFGLRSYTPEAMRLRANLAPSEREDVELELDLLGLRPTAFYRKSEVSDHLQHYFQPAELGAEPTPEEYVERLVDVFREVWRVLRDDGTVWLNLGDSYISGGRTWRAPDRLDSKNGRAASNRAATPTGLKPKDLIGIPWRVAFALQADGWYLRQDIVWHKPNPMPESVRDRCTKAHEYVFLLSKSPKYYYDHEAAKEPMHSNKGNGKSFRGGGSYTAGNSFNNHAVKGRETHGNAPNETGQRNRRSVWTVATRPYMGAHFSTFPPALIEPCILAGCPVGGTVLDPLAGSGTTAGVALKHNRTAVICELNPDCEEMVRERIEQITRGRAACDTSTWRGLSPSLEVFDG